MLSFNHNKETQKKEDNKMKRLVGILLSVILVLMLVGCGKSPAEKLIGKWKYVGDDVEIEKVMEFTEDGSVIRYDMDGVEDEAQYTATDDTITVEGETSSYTIHGDRLIIRAEGERATLVRVE